MCRVSGQWEAASDVYAAAVSASSNVARSPLMLSTVTAALAHGKRWHDADVMSLQQKLIRYEWYQGSRTLAGVRGPSMTAAS